MNYGGAGDFDSSTGGEGESPEMAVRPIFSRVRPVVIGVVMLFIEFKVREVDCVGVAVVAVAAGVAIAAAVAAAVCAIVGTRGAVAIIPASVTITAPCAIAVVAAAAATAAKHAEIFAVVTPFTIEEGTIFAYIATINNPLAVQTVGA